jgi:hypothetical protein
MVALESGLFRCPCVLLHVKTKTLELQLIAALFLFKVLIKTLQPEDY